jgi:hypothetical protein
MRYDNYSPEEAEADVINEITVPAVEEEFTADTRFGELDEDFESLDLESKR